MFSSAGQEYVLIDAVNVLTSGSSESDWIVFQKVSCGVGEALLKTVHYMFFGEQVATTAGHILKTIYKVNLKL